MTLARSALGASGLITKARTKLLIDQPFWGSLLLYLKPVEKPEIQTMATDGYNLFYAPEWVQSIATEQNVEKLKGVLVHEILHVALQHLTRRGTRMPKMWNFAADYAVNQIIKESGMQLPDSVLLDQKYAGMLAEEIYDKLMADQPDQDKETLDNHDLWGEVAKDATKADAMAREWKVRVSQAVNNAKGRGELPNGLKRLVDQILEPQLNWKEILAQYIRPSRGDYTFEAPDNRFLSEEFQNIVLPSFISQEVEDIVMVVDTSGSISERQLQGFISNIHWMLKAYPNLRGLVTSCDTHPAPFQEVTGDTVATQLDLQGGGGTDFVPVFELMEKENVNPSVLIYFTDGDGRYPKEEPPYPVLWVCTSKYWENRVPFGRFIYYTEGDEN